MGLRFRPLKRHIIDIRKPVTGIAGDIDLEKGTFGKDAITQAIALDNERDEAELAAMDEAAITGFEHALTGTGGNN